MKIIAFASKAIDNNRVAVIEGDIVQATRSFFKGASTDKFPLALNFSFFQYSIFIMYHPYIYPFNP